MILSLGSFWIGCSNLLGSQLSFVLGLWNVYLHPSSVWQLMVLFMGISKGSVVLGNGILFPLTFLFSILNILPGIYKASRTMPISNLILTVQSLSFLT